MDSSKALETWRPSLNHYPVLHHHHHPPLFPCPHSLPHHYHRHLLRVSPHCPIHSYLLQPNGHFPACPNSLPLLDQSNLQVPDNKVTYPSDALTMQEENVLSVEEDEEEPVFVLTDEWREFFAKSEAKRKLAKKEARKKGKVTV